MKNLFLLLSFVAFTFPAMAQNEPPGETVTDTVSFVSGPQDSLCNYIFRTEDCSPSSIIKNAANETNKNLKEIAVIAWTFNAGGCGKGWTRAMLNFNGINTIPQNAVITKAELMLRGWTNPAVASTVGNSYYPGSGYNSSGTNEIVIKRIKQSFSYPTVTWNTQPATDTPEVVTRPSQKQYGDDLQVDVKKLVQDMVTKQEFYGFMMMLQVETLYRSFGFHSCFAEDSANRPQLLITYTTNSVTVNNTINHNHLDIYPQPVTDAVNIEFTANNDVEVHYQLYDMRGAGVRRGSVDAVNGRNQIQLQLSGLPSGVYVFTMTDGYTQIRERIIKQ